MRFMRQSNTPTATHTLLHKLHALLSCFHLKQITYFFLLRNGLFLMMLKVMCSAAEMVGS